MILNPFKDQEKFMLACDQSVTGDQAQFDMYINLIAEEFEELQDADTDDLRRADGERDVIGRDPLGCVEN